MQHNPMTRLDYPIFTYEVWTVLDSFRKIKLGYFPVVISHMQHTQGNSPLQTCSSLDINYIYIYPL